jgi:hypothetical protein
LGKTSKKNRDVTIRKVRTKKADENKMSFLGDVIYQVSLPT